MPRWEKAALTAAVVVMAAWAVGREVRSRPGTIVVNVVPADATVLIDNVRVGNNGSLFDVDVTSWTSHREAEVGGRHTSALTCRGTS